jgi:acid phosphatase
LDAAREKQYGNFVSACALNGTNATSTLGIYEGVLPADGAAVQVMSFALNGSTSLLGANSTGSAAKKSGAPAAQAANAWGVLAILATGLAIML